MAKKFIANKKVSQMYKDESFLVYSEDFRVYKVLFSDDNVERVWVILKRIMRSFHKCEVNDYFWTCPYIRSHQVVFKDIRSNGKQLHQESQVCRRSACFHRAYFAKKEVNGDDDINVAFNLS